MTKEDKTCWRCKKRNGLSFGFGLFVRSPDGNYHVYDKYTNNDLVSVSMVILCLGCVDEMIPTVNAMTQLFRNKI